jgi:hypothetical protein
MDALESKNRNEGRDASNSPVPIAWAMLFDVAAVGIPSGADDDLVVAMAWSEWSRSAEFRRGEHFIWQHPN